MDASDGMVGEVRETAPLSDAAPRPALEARVLACESHYAVLNLRPDASAEEVKRAYHSLARVLHPDKSSSGRAGEAFKRVKAAFDVLGTAQRRAAYDLERSGT